MSIYDNQSLLKCAVYEAVRKILKTLLRHYTLSKSQNFDKVYKPDNQSLLKCVVYGRFANAPVKP